jgi:glyoxylase-like metal-dependent hydrolase (beta-lactamase superfamily II)
MRSVAALLLGLVLFACGYGGTGAGTTHAADASNDPSEGSLQELLASAVRVPSRESWFEIIRLPNRVYALWEPGHVEQVNSFLILGSERDVLYDTGMGIASMQLALADIRAAERLPVKPVLVVNSHSHLDHNGGNREFDQVHCADDDWARHRLEAGVPAGSFTAYWDQLTAHPGVAPPSGFDPATHNIPPYPLGQVQYLVDNQGIDLGDRTLYVVRTFSHSPDGIALHDPVSGLFFGGDAFYGPQYLVTDMSFLAKDLERSRHLFVRWHYASHGAQLITAMQHTSHLAAVNRMIAGEGELTQTTMAGIDLPSRALDGVTVTVARELLLY